MKLSHFSDTPITGWENKHTKASEERKFFKPQGLWVSVDGPDDWPSWCEAEDFRNIEEQFHYEVILNENSKVLHLKTTQEIRAFSKQYQVTPEIVGGYVSTMYLNWPKVAQDYDGVIISPYNWELRLDNECAWYYGWDCASGCIWNEHAVKEINLIREPMQKEKKTA